MKPSQFKAFLLDKVQARWGRGWDHLGIVMQEALLNEALLLLLDTQDDSVHPEVLRRIMHDGRKWIIEWVGAQS